MRRVIMTVSPYSNSEVLTVGPSGKTPVHVLHFSYIQVEAQEVACFTGRADYPLSKLLRGLREGGRLGLA